MNTKVEGPYYNIISTAFNQIDVKNKEECQKYRVALYILASQEKLESDDETINRVLTPIKDLFDHPEKYVKLERNFNFYKTIVRDRIVMKIRELEKILTEEPKKEESTSTEQQNDQAPSPESIKLNGLSMIEFLDWLIKVAEDSENIFKIGLGPFTGLVSQEEFYTFFTQAKPEAILNLCYKIPYIMVLQQIGHSLESLWKLDDNLFDQVLLKANEITLLHSVGITLDMLKTLNEDARKIFLDKFDRIIVLVGAGQFSFEDLSAIGDNFVLATLVDDPVGTIKLHKFGMSLQDLTLLKPNQLIFVLKNYNTLILLHGFSEVPLKEIINADLNEEQLNVWNTNTHAISLLNNLGFSLEFIKKLHLEKIQLIQKNVISVGVYLKGHTLRQFMEKYKSGEMNGVFMPKENDLEKMKKLLLELNEVDEPTFLKLIEGKLDTEELANWMKKHFEL